MPEGSGRASGSIGSAGNPDTRALAGAMTILLGLLHAIVGAPTPGQPVHEAGAPGPGEGRGLFVPVPRGQQRVPPGVVVHGRTPGRAGEDAVRDAVAQCPTGRCDSPADGIPSSAAGLAPAWSSP